MGRRRRTAWPDTTRSGNCLCRAEALTHGNELPPRLKASTGAKAVVAGFGPHGVAVTDRTAADTTRVVCIASAEAGSAGLGPLLS